MLQVRLVKGRSFVLRRDIVQGVVTPLSKLYSSVQSQDGLTVILYQYRQEDPLVPQVPIFRLGHGKRRGKILWIAIESRRIDAMLCHDKRS